MDYLNKNTKVIVFSTKTVNVDQKVYYFIVFIYYYCYIIIIIILLLLFIKSLLGK